MVKKDTSRRSTPRRKKAATKASTQAAPEQQEKIELSPISTELEFRGLEVAHLVKYNVYLLAKALVFHSVYPDAESVEEALLTTEHVMNDLDLDAKARRLAAEQQAEDEDSE